jgi:aspartyl-tRNA(Asn)/glutamyl-tRNA(Gln) amidotransferase subunit A
VPKTGAFPLSQSFDTVGPLANSVSCCATAHAIMVGEDEVPLMPRAAQGLRLGVLKNYVLEGLDQEVSSAFEAALARLSKSGAVLADVSFPELDELPSINQKGGIVAAEAYHVHRRRMAERGDLYDPRVFRRIETAAAISAADYLDYFEHRARMIKRLHQLFQGLDALVLPTTMNVPPPVSLLAKTEDYLRFNAMSLRNTYVANFLNGCSLSIPMTHAGDAPAGFMLIAPNGWDSALFSTSAGVEQVVRKI